METPCKEKPLSEVKTLLPQQSGKEPGAETLAATLLDEAMAAKPAEVTPAPVATPMSKGKGSASAEPSPQKGKKKKEPSPEVEELEELEETEETTGETGSSTEGSSSEQVSPPPEAKRVNTRSSKRKQSCSELKTPAMSKKQQKSPGKGRSSQKRPQTK